MLTIGEFSRNVQTQTEQKLVKENTLKCIIVFFPFVWKKNRYGSKQAQNLNVDQCLNNSLFLWDQ